MAIKKRKRNLKKKKKETIKREKNKMEYTELHFYISCQYFVGGSPCRVAAYMLGCDIITSEFELQSWYCIHFLTNTF